MTQPVDTVIGTVPESDLRIELIEDKSDPNVWAVRRECYYVGNDPQKLQLLEIHKRQKAVDPPDVIKRDVWVSIKSGQSTAVEKGS